jgi:hypothetical protein
MLTGEVGGSSADNWFAESFDGESSRISFLVKFPPFSGQVAKLKKSGE